MLAALFRRRTDPPVVKASPPPISTDVLAGAAQVGLDGGVGMVPHYRAMTNPDYGRTDDLGRHLVPPGGTVDQQLTPDSLLVDRPLFGGARSAPHLAAFRPEPDFTGGYVVITGRANVQLGSITYTQDAPAEVVRTPITESGCVVRAKALGLPTGDLAAITRSNARQAIGMAS